MTGRIQGWTGAREWLSRRSIRQVVLGAGAVVLVASGLFGGLDRAAPDPEVALKAGTAHAAEPFELTISKVAWSDDLGEKFGPSLIGPNRVGRYLLVQADIRTDQDLSVASFVVRESLRIRGLSGFAKDEFSGELVTSDDADPRVVVTADRVALGEIAPGLTYNVVFIWEQDVTQPLPTAVQVQSYKHGFRRSSLDDQEDWFDNSPDAVGTFPVTQFGAS